MLFCNAYLKVFYLLSFYTLPLFLSPPFLFPQVSPLNYSSSVNVKDEPIARYCSTKASTATGSLDFPGTCLSSDSLLSGVAMASAIIQIHFSLVRLFLARLLLRPPPSHSSIVAAGFKRETFAPGTRPRRILGPGMGNTDGITLLLVSILKFFSSCFTF